ncbi:sensor histidine kinase [Frigidibacter sp. ROC022]|uniref:sensor histidine kinase n=1 Tax=Frigidibacter sp. ROC022 TaxID=2971796 RepID=UPI00215ABAC7|nr:ATP-binding protein [Frigidibacter sp. ROC022]MCR8724198.1 ATP-binding protein [Frigidibacter sp. ROC022]
MLPRPGPASLRLTLAVAAGIIVISLAAMVAQYRLTERSLTARQIELLQSDMDAFAALYEQRRIPALRQAMEFRAGTDPFEAIFLLQDKAGEKLAGNIETWPEGLPALASDDFSITGLRQFNVILGETLTSYQGVTRMLPGGFPLLVARGTGEVDRTLADLRQMIWVVAAFMVLAALAAGWVVARLVLRRIERLNGLADRVAAGDLAARLPGPRSHDEFGALEGHVHQMLDRIETLNRATHRLSDSIAHELRTPLNRMMQKLQNLKGQDAEIAAIQSEMRGTIRIFDSLLDISSAEAQSGSAAGVVPVDLSQCAAEVFELYEPLGEDKGLNMSIHIDPGLWVLGDRNLIAQLLSNLLDNAIKFTPEGESVTLSLTEGPDRHLLSVTDTGPGLPAEIRDEAFERFVRAERDRTTKGHGLGLALVQAIATRHGARLRLLPVEKGFAVETAWPKLAPPAAAAPGPESPA